MIKSIDYSELEKAFSTLRIKVTVKTPTPKKRNESNVKYMPWRKLWHEHFTQMKKKQST